MPATPRSSSSIPQLLNRLRMRQVALILAVGEHGTLRKASAELGMTQPAATKMIQELESALGQRLFERVGRGQKLTPAGASVLRYFRGMRGSVESMTRELAELEQGGSGRVSVGSIMAPSPNLLTQAIIALKKAYPLLSVDVTMDTSDRLFELLREGVLDVAIGRIRDEHRADYAFTPLENEALALVAGVKHPLAKKKTVKFADLLGYGWILQPHGSPMREVLEQEFRMLQAPSPKGLIETASILTTTNLIAETDMVGVMPESIAGTYARHGLLVILPCFIRHKMEAFGSITRKDRPLSEAARFFLAALHQSKLPVRDGKPH
ncbi:LysR family transcriptional regulator [Polaromonas sp. JS666]|uniref:LysR family transcriptional regulator n=1 Tax=Polaromonas sp. (strain JS666 / ATCC BAA-500) TaxID=296591 RepID=UPI000881CDDE|nr:LysR family transcriptional regulator [Polaromonas sp. JS666]SDM53563.1 DNA-binding transcriptional regulator, LysR family [Polaromonas sp. JS666]